jgi:hypothetical protein
MVEKQQPPLPYAKEGPQASVKPLASEVSGKTGTGSVRESGGVKAAASTAKRDGNEPGQGKKRGRPLGSKSKAKGGKGSDDVVVVDGSGPPSEKKPRGRPKGSKNKPKGREGGAGETVGNKSNAAKAGDRRSATTGGETRVTLATAGARTEDRASASDGAHKKATASAPSTPSSKKDHGYLSPGFRVGAADGKGEPGNATKMVVHSHSAARPSPHSPDRHRSPLGDGKKKEKKAKKGEQPTALSA